MLLQLNSTGKFWAFLYLLSIVRQWKKCVLTKKNLVQADTQPEVSNGESDTL